MESLNLEASVTGEPMPDIEWLRDNESLLDNDRAVLKSKDGVMQLCIKEADVADTGNYILVAKNKLGTVRSSCHVSVNSPPTFAKELQEAKIKAGEDARFDVAITGYPRPDLSWFFNGELLESQERFEVVNENESAFLIMKNCTMEDTGVVKCTASNCVGEISSETRLEVAQSLTAPEVTQDVQLDMESQEGEDVLLSLPFSGDGIEVRW